MKNQAVKIPEWLQRAAIYQINLRTFSGEGTIKAAERELPVLKEMGFRIMYLCPVFEEDDSADPAFFSPRQIASKTNNPKNPYRMKDYFKIDSEYGSMQDLEDFIKAAHALDMKVLLDLVYMHIGANAPIIQKHPEFVLQNNDGSFCYNSYHFATLDFHSQGLREYLWCNMVYYISVLDADGFRCDVGDAVPDDFWVEGRRRIKAVKPDAVLINEGAQYHRLATSFDSAYNFQWHGDLYRVFSGEMSVPQLVANENARMSKVPIGGLLLLDMDNHDTVTDWEKRMELLIGHDGMEMVQVLNYSMVGIPMVYCGNELADQACLSMFANRFYPGKFETTDRAALRETSAAIRRREIMKKLNTLLAENTAIYGSGFKWLETDCSEQVVAFERFDTEKKVILIANLTDSDVTVTPKCELPDLFNNILLENHASCAENTVQLGTYGYLLSEI